MAPRAMASAPDEDEVEFDAAMTYSQRELLQRTDFEKMSGEELAAARRLVARMRLPIMDVPTRRFRPDPRGRRIDMRATLRASLRSGGVPALRRRNPRRRHPPLVIICDISGSMSRYSRIVLHFMHAVTNDRDRVFSFLFGTRLTNITRMLRHRDVDVAVDRVADTVQDWSGGTRIGHCLAEFNAKWSRRVLGQGALVLFISDGLDRDSGEGLTREIERLHKSCRRLIWLNPLLRYDAYEPKSLGATGDHAAYRRLPADPQSGEPRGTDRGPRAARPAAHGRSRVARGATEEETSKWHQRRNHSVKTSWNRRQHGARPGVASHSRPWSRHGGRHRGLSAASSRSTTRAA